MVTPFCGKTRQSAGLFKLSALRSFHDTASRTFCVARQTLVFLRKKGARFEQRERTRGAAGVFRPDLLGAVETRNAASMSGPRVVAPKPAIALRASASARRLEERRTATPIS